VRMVLRFSLIAQRAHVVPPLGSSLGYDDCSVDSGLQPRRCKRNLQRRPIAPRWDESGSCPKGATRR
jgi:hypothetical protein